MWYAARRTCREIKAACGNLVWGVNHGLVDRRKTAGLQRVVHRASDLLIAGAKSFIAAKELLQRQQCAVLVTCVGRVARPANRHRFTGIVTVGAGLLRSWNTERHAARSCRNRETETIGKSAVACTASVGAMDVGSAPDVSPRRCRFTCNDVLQGCAYLFVVIVFYLIFHHIRGDWTQ